MTPQRKVVKFVIDGKVVRYYDDMWMNGIQIYPLNKILVQNLATSRSTRMRSYADLIAEANYGKNLEEYESCKNEEDIANKIKSDAKTQALIELK